MTRDVVTYQLAYLTHRFVDLCDECCGRGDHEAGALGPVSRGKHWGECEGARHGRHTCVVLGERVTCTAEYEKQLAPEDRGDVGIVRELRDGQAFVGWSSGVSTWIDVNHLREVSA